MVVGFGNGCDLDKLQIFNDKEWIATDNNPASRFYGRTYVTWTAFVARSGEYIESAIMETHSDDGGAHWTDPREISGSNRDVCTSRRTKGRPMSADILKRKLRNFPVANLNIRIAAAH